MGIESSKIVFIFLFLFFSFWFSSIRAANPLNVVINEIAWMGNETSSNKEWIEFYNNSNEPVNLDGWVLKAEDGTPEIQLSGNITGNSFYLLERTDDETLPNTSADQIYTGALNNLGENLKLYDESNNLIDSLNCNEGWFTGDNQTKQTMERKNSQSSGNDSLNWQTSLESRGTPKEKNSSGSLVQEPELNREEPIPNQTPQAEAGNDVIVWVGSEIKFSGSKSSDPDGDALSFLWNFGDGSTSVKKEPGHIFQYPGQYIVSLTVSDGEKSSSDQLQVTVFSNSLEISEFIPNPAGSDQENEWIELYNNSSEIVNITLWQLDDQEGGSNPFVFPENTFISPYQYLVLSRKVSKIALNNNKDSVRLFYPTGQLSQEINYQKAKEGWVIAKSGESYFWTKNSTPGLPNIINGQGTASNEQYLKPFISEVAEASPSPENIQTLTEKTSVQNQDLKTEQQLTAAEKSSTSSLKTILFALVIAILSGIGILFLKRKTKK